MRHPTLKLAPERIREFNGELRYPGGPDAVRELHDKITAWIRSIRSAIATQKDRVSSQFAHGYRLWNGREPSSCVPINHEGWLTNLRVGAYCAVGLECLFASVLASIVLNAPRSVAVGIGLALTLCLTSVMKAAFRLWAARHHEQPRKAVAQLNLALAWVLPWWVLAFIGTVQFARMISEATALAEWVFALLLTVLTVTSPMVAGILFSACDLRSWAHGPTREWEFLETLEHAVDELENRCRIEKGDSDSGGEEADSEEQPASRAMAASKSLAVAALLAFSASGLAAETRCELWVDKSTSPAVRELATATGSALALLAKLGEKSHEGMRCGLYGFAGDSFYAVPTDEASFPAAPSDQCPPPARTSELGLFRPVALHAQEQEQRRCRDIRQQRQKVHEDAVGRAIRSAREHLGSYSPTKPERTCLVDVFLRLSQATKDPAPELVLLVTDGEETCLPAYRQPIPAPKIRGKTVMALVPKQTAARGESQAEWHRRTSHKWRQIVPWVSVIALQDLDERVLSPQ